MLLYNTGNYSQYPMINHNGTENEKENIFVTKSLWYRAEIIQIIMYFEIYFKKFKKLLKSTVSQKNFKK